MTFLCDYQKKKNELKQALHIDKSFDLICKDTMIGARKACIFFVDGLTKDEVLQKLLSGFYTIQGKDMPENASDFFTRSAHNIQAITLWNIADNIFYIF